MPVIKTCPICKKKFKVFSYRPRDTCGSECRAKLAVLNNRERIAKIEPCVKTVRPADPTPSEIVEETHLRGSLRVKCRTVDSEPRRRCPVCKRGVRLVNSVAGAVWLRAHYIEPGNVCDGSREIISYPMEKELASDEA